MMTCPGLPVDGDSPKGSVVQSVGSVNYNRSNTGTMATLPHFPKQRPARHSAYALAVTRCYAWLTLGRLAVALCLFLEDGCTVFTLRLFRRSSAQNMLQYVTLMRPVIIHHDQIKNLAMAPGKNAFEKSIKTPLKSIMARTFNNCVTRKVNFYKHDD